MSRQLTRSQADAALAAIKQQFASYIAAGSAEPKLHEPGFHTTGWSISWDDGPCDWPQLAFQGGFDEDLYFQAKNAGATDEQARRIARKPAVPAPSGIFSEAVNSGVLGLYRES